jgi:hypothetical protein
MRLEYEQQFFVLYLFNLDLLKKCMTPQPDTMNLNQTDKGKKVKISLLQAMEAHRVARG